MKSIKLYEKWKMGSASKRERMRARGRERANIPKWGVWNGLMYDLAHKAIFHTKKKQQKNSWFNNYTTAAVAIIYAFAIFHIYFCCCWLLFGVVNKWERVKMVLLELMRRILLLKEKEMRGISKLRIYMHFNWPNKFLNSIECGLEYLLLQLWIQEWKKSSSMVFSIPKLHWNHARCLERFQNSQHKIAAAYAYKFKFSHFDYKTE